MFDSVFTLDSPTGAALATHVRSARGTARGTVLVSHGLAEHAGRYACLAADLAEAGFNTFAHDHRGHGATAARDAPLRRFAHRDGEAKVVADALCVARHARAAHPGLPLVIFGHSMGAFVAANLAARAPAGLAGLALWNADLNPGLNERVARLALRAERALKGSDVSSAVLQRATFEAWARAVAPRRTAFDWLSHDERAVDAYVADPLCGFSPTISMMEDVVSLIVSAGSREGLARLPDGLPIHLLGGSEDPATGGGAAVERLAERLAAAGRHAVELRIVEGARHETLNEAEPMRGEALASLIGWLDRLPTLAPGAVMRLSYG